MDKKRRTIDWLSKASAAINIAQELSKTELSDLAQSVIRNYEIDKYNRREWDQQSERALKLAKQVLEAKSTPWENASNVKYPLITVATIQFAARAYPEICKGNSIVKCQITGDDKAPKAPEQPAPGAAPGTPPPSPGQGPPQLPAPGPGQPQPMPGQGPEQQSTTPPEPGPKQSRSNRIQSHMNWQLTQEMIDWEADMDTMLHVLPVLGQCYKKSYFSGLLGRNVSELVLPDDCVVSKGRSRDIKAARRITHRLWIYHNEAIEKMRSKMWLDVDLPQAPSDDNDTDAPHEFLEQHCYHDLDGDGYKEPYIITVHKQTMKVVRIVARFVLDGLKLDGKKRVIKIEPDHYFTHYGFIPNPDGSMNYLGFGHLQEPINASINTVLNQLIDSGTLANAGGGFVGRGIKMRGGTFSFKPGEWKFVDVAGASLKDNLIPLPIREPSTVLYQLLVFLVGAGKEISAIQDVLTGDAHFAANMPVGTMMALVEQGLKVYVAVYKRVYRSLTEELKKLYHLNARFLDPKVSFQISGHSDQFVMRSDYVANDTSVMPVADPELSSDMQRLLKAQALKEVSGRPGLDEVELTRRFVRAIRPDDMEKLLLTDGQMSGAEKVNWRPPPPPQTILAQAKAMRMQQQAQEGNIRLQMDLQRFNLDIQEVEARINQIKADTMRKLAESDSAGKTHAMDYYKFQVDQLQKQLEMRVQAMKMSVDAQLANNKMQLEHQRQIAQSELPGAGEEMEGRQFGGSVAEGEPYVVGEAGPEIFVPGGAAPKGRPFWYDDEEEFELH